jgi:hypothetical protein
MRGRRGKDLQKLRTELTERSFAHMYETAGMRRTHLKGQKNILKRLLFHAVGFNLALLIRKSSGIGKHLPKFICAAWTMFTALGELRFAFSNDAQ